MGLFSWINKGKSLEYEDLKQLLSDMSGYESNKVGTIEIPDKLTDDNAFMLANTVSEIYFPIDFHSDRASKLRYYIADKSGKEIAPTSELNRFINDINPFYTFSELVYQFIFNYLSDGNAVPYAYVPKGMNPAPSISNITRLDVLIPTAIEWREYTNLSTLEMQSIASRIESVHYNEGKRIQLNKEALDICSASMVKRDGSTLLGQSMLYKSYRAINNLLATYSARYNVYVNNGAAGYLSKKQSTAGGSLADAVDPVTRQTILNDINDRNGITGRRNFWGISSTPIEFVNTLGTIKDLMPFEETLLDAIQIASTMGLPKDLVPRPDNSTFDNQIGAERQAWENATMSLVNTACASLSKVTTLAKNGYQYKADFSSVSVLKDNEKDIEAVRKQKLDNLKMLTDMGVDVKNEIELIKQEYGNKIG